MIFQQELSLCPNRSFSAAACAVLEKPPVKSVLDFHRQLPEYQATPLQALPAMARKLGISQLWCKDESHRFGLKAYKVLGGAYAIARFLQQKHQLKALRLSDLYAHRHTGTENQLVFATTTDGNHGAGVAYMAAKLGYSSQVYVPEATVKSRIAAIEKAGGKVTVFPGSYDDAVRQIARDAQKFNWQLIADTAWNGYTQIPAWIMEGYTTVFEEAAQQLQGQPPTHIFIQAGVGSLAASLCRYFRSFYPAQAVKIVVVEPHSAACFFRSAQINDGNPHPSTEHMDTMMAGLACAEPNPLAWQIIRDAANYLLSCSDSIAVLGMQAYYHPQKGDPRIVSGESGAVTLGALYKILSDKNYAAIQQALGLQQDARVLLINTEGDTDPLNFQLHTGRSA